MSVRARLLVFAAGLAAVFFIGWCDYLAGPLLSLTIFYLVPILVVTWTLDLIPGVLFSLICNAVSVLADVARPGAELQPLAVFWEGISSLAVFLFLTFVIVTFRAVLEREVELARTDPLTGAANSRSFRERAELEMNRARRSRRPIMIAYVDVDNFKAVNDRSGHSAGDRLLRTITGAIQNNLRASDMVARLGGDEFALLLPETAYDAAALVMNRVESALAEAMAAESWPVTFSIGVVTFREPPENVDSLIHIADGMMYSAKGAGRNTMRHVLAPARGLAPERRPSSVLNG